MNPECSDITVLDRLRAGLKWQQPEQQESYNFSELSGVISTQTTATHVQGLPSGDSVFDDLFMTRRQVKPDPGSESAWHELREIGPSGYGLEMNYGISTTTSCPPAVAATIATEAVEVKGKQQSAVGRESFKKRKADKLQNSKVVADDESKKIKACGEEEDGESKITGQTADTSKENSKVTEVRKPDYIHVRARRGQATDSHSLAERVRREKISERMKYLQDLVPGCNKITGKAGMLDEIINYVQSLQRQVEFLSMKLAAVNPCIDNLFAKDMSSETANPYYLQYNQVQQVVSCSGLEMGLNAPDVARRRTISAPVSIPDPSFLHTSCFTQIQPFPTWDVELQNVYNVAYEHGRWTTPFQPFTGSIEANRLKMEM